MARQMITSTFRFEEEKLERLRALSLRSKVSQAILVRRALDMLLEIAEPIADGDVWQAVAPEEEKQAVVQ